MKLQVLLFVALLVASAYASTLYSIVTEFSENDEETRVYTVMIDRTTGSITNVTADFIYAGGSATVDGISAFDQVKGTYYWATDSADAFIYSSDVKNKQPLAPLDIGAKAIVDMTYNSANNRLYSIYQSQNTLVLAAIGPQTLQTVLAIPSKYNAGYIMKGAIDASTNTYYLAAKVGPSSGPTYAVATIDLENGLIVKEVAVNNQSCLIFPEFMWFDKASGMLFGGAESFESSNLQYYFFKVNPATGACQKTFLKTPVGIVTAWSFDSSTNQLWFSEATNSGAYVISYNVKSGQMTSPVLVAGGVVPESIEVSLNF